MAHEEATFTRWSSAESFHDQLSSRRNAGSARLVRAMTCSYISPVSIFSSNNEKRFQIVQEIVETEEKYVSCLYILKSVFEDPLQDLGLIPAKDLDIIFPKELEQIRNEHKVFLSKLKQLVKWWNLESCVGEMFADLFSKKGDQGCLWEQYSAYLNNFPKAIGVTQKATASCHKIAQILEEYSSNPFCEGLNLPAFLLTPIQRLPRYVLLLKQLFKNTDSSHPDSSQIDHAIEVMSQVMSELNESIELSLQVASNTKWQKRQVTSKRKLSRTDKDNIQICQRLPEPTFKPNDSSTRKSLSSPFGGSLDGTVNSSLSTLNTSSRPLSICSRSSNVTTNTSFGNRSSVSSGYFSEEDHPYHLESPPFSSESPRSSFLYNKRRSYGSQDFPQGDGDDDQHAVQRERKTSFSIKRRASMNFVALQAVLKWKQFTKKKIHFEKEKYEKETQHSTTDSQDGATHQPSYPTLDESVSTCHVPTVSVCSKRKENFSGDSITNNKLASFEPEAKRNNDNEILTPNFKLRDAREKKPVPERKKGFMGSINDLKHFLPIIESESETETKSSSKGVLGESSNINPWLLTERERSFRSRSRDRKDSFRSYRRRDSLRSLRSRLSSFPGSVSMGDTDSLSSCDELQTQGLSAENINIMNEPFRCLPLKGDEDEEEFKVENGKAFTRRRKISNESQLNKGKKNPKRPRFRFFSWITAFRRRRKKRRSMTQMKKMSTTETDYSVDYSDAKEQVPQKIITVERVTSL